MTFFEVFLIGVGLSMDAFAVSVCKGLAMSKITFNNLLILAGAFGIFQALMPLLGFFLGNVFYKYMIRFGPWISCLLLVYIGGKLIIDSIKEEKSCTCEEGESATIRLYEVLMLAIATSIDAFAVGVTFSLMAVNIYSSILIIGITTFLISAVAVFLGHVAGIKYRTPARILGGVVLIVLGIRIVVTSVFV